MIVMRPLEADYSTDQELLESYTYIQRLCHDAGCRRDRLQRYATWELSRDDYDCAQAEAADAGADAAALQRELNRLRPYLHARGIRGMDD